MDTLGLMVAVVVHAADVPDRLGARRVLRRMRGWYPRLQIIFADSAYTGPLQRFAGCPDDG